VVKIALANLESADLYSLRGRAGPDRPRPPRGPEDWEEGPKGRRERPEMHSQRCACLGISGLVVEYIVAIDPG